MPTPHFRPGQSGNPKGRPPGTGNQLHHLLKSNTDALVQKCIDMALGGDQVAMKLCVDRISSVPRPEGERLHIPGLAEAASLPEKCQATLAAVATGTITAESGRSVLMMIDTLQRAVTVAEHERRLQIIEGRRLHKEPLVLENNSEGSDLV